MSQSPAIVSMPAEIDMTNTADVSADLARAITASARIVIADLSATTFCDSSGIRTLLVTAHQAASSGTELRLVVEEDGAVQRVIALMGIDRLLPVYPTLGAALAGEPG
jgi:anti-sigma B factor antagonist